MKIITLIEEYLDYCRHTKKLSPHTLRAYTIDLTEFLKFARPTRSIHDCKREIINNYVRYLFEERQLKESSVKRRIACLKAMYRWLELEDRITENPFHRLSLKIRLPATLPKSLSNNEMRRLMMAPIKKLGYASRAECSKIQLDANNTEKERFIHLTTLVAIELLFVTGIRVGELCGLQITDLDLQAGTIRIYGKGNRERIVFLPYSETRELVKTYIKIRSQLYPSNEKLLVTPRSKAADSQYIRMLVRRAGENAGLKRKVTPHMLRHTTATELLNNGIDIRFVQKLLGHQSITTTQIYTQVTDSALRRAVTRGHPLRRMMSY